VPTLAVDVQILMLDAMGCAQSLSSIADSYPSRQIRMQFALGPTVLLYRIAIARGFTAARGCRHRRAAALPAAAVRMPPAAATSP